MKLVILLGDGMADHPIEALDGKTPIEAAETPNMDRIAREGRGGLARNVPSGMPPGSDVANLSVMGYDPKRYYSGRAPLEAAAMGVALGADDVAFRCNLVNVDLDERVMVDYSAGHISSEEGRELIAALQKNDPKTRLYPGVSYRNLLVQGENDGLKAVCTPPHDIAGQPINGHLPKGEGSAPLREMMASSVPILAEHPVNLRRAAQGKRPANMIWLWGQGKAPSMPKFREIWGIKGAMISAVDLLKGMGVYAGLEVIDVPGATGVLDTNYEGKVAACLDALDRVDFVYLHVEAPDEMGHDGKLDEKIEAIRRFDARVVGPVLAGLEKSGHNWRVMVLPDHPTPISIRTHTAEPVPFAMMGSSIEPDEMMAFSEREGARGGYGEVDGWRLMGMMVERSMKIYDREIFAVAQVRYFYEDRGTIDGNSASGFFYEHEDNLYFITNRHVVIDKDHCPHELRLTLHKDPENLRDNEVYPIKLYKNFNGCEEHCWLEHPQNKDRKSDLIDLVALPIDRNELSKFYIRPFSDKDILPDHLPEGIRGAITGYSIWEHLLVIGYSEGFYDSAHNLPIIRSASLASVIYIPFNKKPKCLIDTQLPDGTSGSPVIVRPKYYYDQHGYPNANFPGNGKNDNKYLLGVHSGEFNKMCPGLGLHNVWFAGLIQDIITKRSKYFYSLGCKLED